jgi:uncharacterized membrane protein
MMATGVSRIAAFGAATGSRVPAAPAALAWPATSSDPAWVRAPLTRGTSALLVAGEAVGDQLTRTKSRLVPVQLIPRLVLAAGGGALLAARPRQRPLLGAGVPVGGSLAGVYGGLLWRTWAAGKSGRDAYGAVGGCAGPRCRGLVRAPGKALLTAPRQ